MCVDVNLLPFQGKCVSTLKTRVENVWSMHNPTIIYTQLLLSHTKNSLDSWDSCSLKTCSVCGLVWRSKSYDNLYRSIRVRICAGFTSVCLFSGGKFTRQKQKNNKTIKNMHTLLRDGHGILLIYYYIFIYNNI